MCEKTLFSGTLKIFY